MAVAEQAHVAMRDDDPEIVHAHMKIVQRLVTESPGLPTYRGHAFRMIIWADLRHSGQALGMPMLPFENSRHSADLSAQLHCDVHEKTTATLQSLGTCPHDIAGRLYEAFSRVHQLCRMFDEPDATAETARDVMYASMYSLCTMVSTIHERDSSTITTFDVLVVTAQLFLVTSIREFIPMRNIQAGLLNWLHQTMQSREVISWWRDEAGLKALLWVLFVCSSCSMTGKADEKASSYLYFFGQLGQVTRELFINDLETLCTSLQVFPWKVAYCQQRCEVLGQLLRLKDIASSGSNSPTGSVRSTPGGTRRPSSPVVDIDWEYV